MARSGKARPAKKRPAKAAPRGVSFDRGPYAGKSAPAPSAREAKQAERREAILTAALAEFSAQGFTATRLDDVARRAGIAKGTIYLYFRDKESLFQELIRTRLSPIVGTIEALRDADVPVRALADQLVELFVREVFGTQRKDVIRLMIAEGPRFPKLAEFYYREVLSRIIAALRTLLKRAHERGEVGSDAVVRFPQLIAAPGLVAVVWSGLFDRFEPLDVRAMMKAHVDLLFTPGRAA
ncbi:MAG: TetR/AcrR family transcriptional regulator [Hyphomicrobiales bacterium]